MSKVNKQLVVQEELSELRRVGLQSFQAVLRDQLVEFDLSVVDARSQEEVDAQQKPRNMSGDKETSRMSSRCRDDS